MYRYFTANTIIELMCFLIAIIVLAKDKNMVWKSMILYIFITCATEISGLVLGKIYHNNQWLYNIFLLFEAGFTYLMFNNLFNGFKNSKTVIFTGLVIFCFSYIYDLLKHGFSIFNYITFSVMSVQFVLYSLYYFFLLLKDDRYVELKTSAEFWWIAGILFFYFGNTASNLFDDKVYSIVVNGQKNDLTAFIFKALNIILYTCWSYSFICRKWAETSQA